MKPLKLISTLGLAVPALALLAFGPRGMREKPKDAVVVEYWEEWTGPEGDAIRDSVNDFNTTVGREKGIFVNLLTASGVLQKTIVSTAAGVPPDIAGLENTQIPQFAELDAMETLDDLALEHGITGEPYKKVFWDACHYNGKLYALPSTPYDYALFYDQRALDKNADKLRAVGMDPGRAPKTIAELDAYAKCLDVVDGNGHISVSGYLPLEPGWAMSYTCYWFGGSWWDEKNKKFDFLNPAVVDSYKWVQSYCKRLGPQAVQAFRSGVGNYDSPQNAFMSGAVSMEQQGPFLANYINTRAPAMAGHWRAAKFPGVTEELNDATYCDVNVFTIPRGAKHKREAFEFIAYMQQQGPMEKLCGAHTKISALKQVSKDFYVNNKNPYIGVFDELAASPHARCAPQVPILAEVEEEMLAFNQRLASMEVTPEQGLADMQERLQASLDHFNMIQADRRKAAATGSPSKQ